MLFRLSLLCLVASTLTAQIAPPALHAPTAVLPIDSAPFQRLLDTDGDGDMDAVGTRVYSTFGNYELRIWRNDKGTMTLIRTLVVSRNVYKLTKPTVMRVSTGDWNGDGKDDFVVSYGDKLDLYVMQSASTFATSTFNLKNTLGGYALDAQLADVDGDGKDDIVNVEVPKSSNGVNYLTVHFAKGGSISAVIGAEVTHRIDVVDIDGDKAKEFALHRDTRYQTVNVTSGRLAAGPVLTTDIVPVSTMPFLWMSGDIDGDKDEDVVVFQPALARNYDPLFQVFRRTGATTFQREKKAVGGPAEYLADIDGDGDLDGVCCGGGGGSQPEFFPKLNFASQFEISPNDGKGGFARAWAFPGAGSKSMAGVADLDGDGDVELVAGRVIYVGQGPWKRDPMPKTGSNTYVLRRRMVKDDDRDGDIDLMHNPYGGARGLGDGSFVQLRLPGVTPPSGYRLAGGFDVDFDGDGATDRIMPMFDPQRIGWVFKAMVWIRNNGGGTYHYAGPVGSVRAGWGYTVDNFAHGDLDGDGDQDLVANSHPTRDGYRCQIFWNDKLKLVTGPSYASARFEGVADFDGDKRPDLLLNAGGNLLVARGTGNATSPFATPVTVGVTFPYRPNGLQIVDMNGDGRPDIVAATTTQPVMALNFASGFQVVWLGMPFRDREGFLSAGDFNGDGRMDLIAGPLKGEPNVSVLFVAKPTSGTNRSLSDYQTTRIVVLDGFAADVDADGDTDLVGAHTVYSTKYHGDQGGHKRQVGSGTAGEGGSIPMLGVTGALRAGERGSVVLRGVPAPTIAFLGMSLGEAVYPDFPVPGMTFRLDPRTMLTFPIVVTGDSDGRGAGSLVVPYVIPKTMFGLRKYLQAMIIDRKAKGGATITSALAEYVGR